jgi:hypothetical protein
MDIFFKKCGPTDRQTNKQTALYYLQFVYKKWHEINKNNTEMERKNAYFCGKNGLGQHLLGKGCQF